MNEEKKMTRRRKGGALLQYVTDAAEGNGA